MLKVKKVNLAQVVAEHMPENELPSMAATVKFVDKINAQRARQRLQDLEPKPLKRERSHSI